jgi:DNA-binding transcriptional regulator YiaG
MSVLIDGGGFVGTSGDGVLQNASHFLIRVCGALTLPARTSAEDRFLREDEQIVSEQTNSGLVERKSEQSSSAAILELRKRSGLTWDQIARLFGVARRSVHFWASGEALKPGNEERLNRMLAVIRHIDRGSAKATRTALMSQQEDGMIPFDLLAQAKYEDVKERLGVGAGHHRPILPPLSAEPMADRNPLAPDVLVSALQDTVHREVGISRVARTVRTKNKKGDGK